MLKAVGRELATSDRDNLIATLGHGLQREMQPMQHPTLG
jgi:hypothetical protein